MSYYPDVETLLLDLLERDIPALALAAGVRHVDTETPDDLEAALPFAQVNLATGSEDVDRVTETCVVDVDVWHSTRDGAYALAGELAAFLTAGPHRVGAAVIDRILIVERPRRLPADDERLFRFGLTIATDTRR